MSVGPSVSPSFTLNKFKSLIERYLMNQLSDFSGFFLQRVTFLCSLNGELTNFEQNSDLARFTHSFGQSDHLILKSRYLMNWQSDFFDFSAVSYIFVISTFFINKIALYILCLQHNLPISYIFSYMIDNLVSSRCFGC